MNAPEFDFETTRQQLLANLATKQETTAASAKEAGIPTKPVRVKRTGAMM